MLSDSNIKSEKYDTVVIGSGIAGLYAALHIDDKSRVAVVTKAKIDESNSWLAQGGIAAVMTKEDNSRMHIEDTLKAGAGLCDQRAVEVLVEEGPENIRELISMNVPFDVDSEGELQITREGGHRLRRIVHCGGDATGRETTKRLSEIVMERSNIDVMFDTFLVDVLTDEKGVVGCILYDGETGKYRVCETYNLIIAAGGIGQLYSYTSNPVGAVGDGIACAARAGARCINMEMVQFHPTMLITGEESDRLFLISEAVRGEGAILRNKNGEAFMQGKHEMADLAPRDIVTRFILKELEKTGDEHAFLDCSSMTEEFFSKRFPTIYGECKKHGINLTKDMIPVHPAQHYFMGGVEADLNGETNVPGLYVCGESACTGIHGANRLASNSVLECLVFGRRAARHINQTSRRHGTFDAVSFFGAIPVTLADFTVTDEEAAKDKKLLRKTLTEHFGAVRNAEGMNKALEILKALYNKYDHVTLSTPFQMEVCNMTETALMIARGAVNRKESVGAHYLV